MPLVTKFIFTSLMNAWIGMMDGIIMNKVTIMVMPMLYKNT